MIVGTFVTLAKVTVLIMTAAAAIMVGWGIEDGKKTKYDLTPEQQANVTAMNRKVEHQKGKGNRSQRKPNEVKESIIKELAEFLREDAQGQLYEEVTITNANRMITFIVNGKSYDLTLIEKRAPK